MIFFGNRAKQINGQILSGLTCPSCNQEEFASFGILRYFHLYWIPTLVTSKVAGIECLHCKRTIIGEELPDDLASSLEESLFTKNKVIPFFSGSIILAILIASALIASSMSSKQEMSQGLNPLVGDVYVANYRKLLVTDSSAKFEYSDSELKRGWGEFLNENPELTYGDLIVSEVSGDDIFLKVNLMVRNKSYDSEKSTESVTDEYDQELLIVRRSEIENLLDENVIVRIERSEF